MKKTPRKVQRWRRESIPAVGGDGLPIYKRIKLEVTRMLSSGAFGPDDPLPTEKELAGKFRASVGTVRRAMDDLVVEHVVVRQQGRGTFLAPFSAERMLNRFWPVFRKDGGREIPIVQTLKFEESRADSEVVRVLQLSPGQQIYHIVNLLLMGGNPVLLDDVRVPRSLFPGLTEQNFVTREMTMYGLYQMRYGVNVIRTIDRLHAVVADRDTARRFGIAAGAPLLSFTRVAYTFNEQPVELRRTLLNTETYEYRNAIGGENRVT